MSVLERVANDELRRVMVFLPPRHSKSETVSRLFTAYYLYRHPERWVGLNSYAADLAHTLSRSARDHFRECGGQIRPDAAAVNHWETPQGGGMWAAGVGGPITGRGFHLGVIDDPLKNAEEASSETIRAKQKDWYNSTFYTREEPGGAIVVIQTRWHADDLSGWLLAGEEDADPENWHIVNLPAIAEEPGQFPEGCTQEPDWRQPGEALCPERYPAQKLRKIENRIGGYYFGALYQQRPTCREGSFFHVGQFKYLDSRPAGLRLCRAWDFAATRDAGDWTAGVLLGTDGERWYVCDVVRGRWDTDARNQMVKATAEKDGKLVRIRGAEDPGSAGKDAGLAFIRMLAGWPVRMVRVSGPKDVRADPFSAQVNAGNVTLVRGAWNTAFVEELRQFPMGAHDDAVDAVADSFAELSQGTGKVASRTTPSAFGAMQF